MANKGISKAAKELISSGIYEVTPEILLKLEELHPPAVPLPADLPAHDDTCQWQPLDDEDDNAFMRGVVGTFLDASRGGPSQLLPLHLKEALQCDSELAATRLIKALIRLTNACASGCSFVGVFHRGQPPAQEIVGARGCPASGF